MCYIRDQRDPDFTIAGRARALGVDYVEIPERHSFDFRAWSAVRQLVCSRRIQIVHCHEYKTDLLAWLLGRLQMIVPLATSHGWSGGGAKETRVYYPIDKRLLARFPLVLAVSEPIRRGVDKRRRSARAGAGPSERNRS